MKVPTHADAFEVLCLQAASDGRNEVLFGDCLQRARTSLRPFMLGREFPYVYLEFPLIGDPFMDVTMLYGLVDQGTHVDSPAAPHSDELFDWYAPLKRTFNDIAFGFELDVENPELPAAAVHFQPRAHRELVEPFCSVAGESERAALYLDLAERMPANWDLSFFGMFRGRPGSPLRVCGYLLPEEVSRCAEDAHHLPDVFGTVGFTAYDDAMLEQVRTLLAACSTYVDYQFDVYPDGSLGDTFALDIELDEKNPRAIQQSFSSGMSAQIMGMLEAWGAADERWKRAGSVGFARALPVELDDGSMGRYSFALMPHWLKARWRGGVLQPSKLYLSARAGLLD